MSFLNLGNRLNHWEWAGVLMLFVGFGMQVKSIPHYEPLLMGAALPLLIGFFVHLRAFRLVVSTPTSKIRSAQQGFNEFKGWVIPVEEGLSTPVSMLPCAWYSYEIFEHTEKSFLGSSRSSTFYEESFVPIAVTDDDQHLLLVHPGVLNRLEFPKRELVQRHGVLNDSTERHIEHFLRASDPVFLQGELKTLSISGWTAAKALAGPKSKPETVRDIHYLLVDFMRGKGSRFHFSADSRKVNVLVPSKSHRVGFVAYGTERNQLSREKWGLLFTLLLAAVSIFITVKVLTL